MFIPNEGRSYGNGHYLFEKPVEGDSITDLKPGRPHLEQIK